MGTQQESPAEKRSAAYQLFLLVLSIYVLTVLVIETWFVSDPEIQRVLQFIDLSICIVFLGDFFWNLYAADDRRQYLKWGWIDFISSIPAIDPLRWGRLSRVIRIIRFLRAIKSFKILAQSLQRSRFESLTLIVVLVTFLAFTLCSSLILEYERHEDSPIRTAGDALWWSFLNIMNAKVSITTAVSQEGMILTIILNKVGFLLFAYFNAIIIAWLIQKRVNIKEAKTGLNASSSGSSMEAEKKD